MNDQQTVSDAKKILVVDDNPDILNILKTVLAEKGYRVLTATEGSEAVNIVCNERPDLIVLDLIFPADMTQSCQVWDGFRIMAWLRRMGRAKNVPVIIVSGSDPDEYEERCLAAGAAAFLPKPLDIHKVLATVRASLGEEAESEPSASA